jgi:hypothetical protein
MAGTAVTQFLHKSWANLAPIWDRLALEATQVEGQRRDTLGVLPAQAGRLSCIHVLLSLRPAQEGSLCLCLSLLISGDMISGDMNRKF